MRLNNREDLTPICATENVPLFVMYVKGELPDKHKSKLESHISHCSDCKINLAYVEEILRVKHPLSLDEKTLLLKYLTDPLFYYFISDIRRKVLSDVRDIVKEANIHLKSDNIEIDKDEKPKQSSKLTYQKRPYSYTLMTALIAAFVSLSSLIVLGLGIKYPALQSYLPFSNSASPVVEERLPSNLDFTLPTMSLPNRAETNRYQQLDTAIDDFLATQDRQHLEKAESIAKDIQLFYEDNYGVDLVGYYQSVPSIIIPQLADSRKKLALLVQQPIVDNYHKNLTEVEKISQVFTSYGNLVEAYKAKTLVAKLQVKLLNYNEAETTINKGLNFAQKNNYLILEGYFTLWQAKRLSEISEFSLAEELLKQTITLGNKLQINELFTSPSMTLAAIYLKNDNNKEALRTAQNILANSKGFNIEHTISSLQIAGVSAFNNNFRELSKVYLNEAIKLSKEYGKPYPLVMSYTFMGVTLSEAKDFEQAEAFYSKAQLVADSIIEKPSKLATLSITLGYEAKMKLTQGDLAAAIELYEQTLSIVNDLGIDNNLEISQLQEGLAIALEKSGKSSQAQQHLTIAKTYQRIADSKKETSNCLLSFLPNNCKPSID